MDLLFPIHESQCLWQLLARLLRGSEWLIRNNKWPENFLAEASELTLLRVEISLGTDSCWAEHQMGVFGAGDMEPGEESI